MSREKEKGNKEFILRYIDAINGKVKDAATCDQFITDERLKEHILFF